MPMKTKVYRMSKYVFETIIIVLSIIYIVVYGGMYKENVFHIAVWNILNIIFWRELYRTAMRKSYDDEDDGVMTVVIMFINSMISIVQIIAASIIICMISNWINITIMGIITIVFFMKIIKVKILLRLSDR